MITILNWKPIHMAHIMGVGIRMDEIEEPKLKVALAGNANVGKSVIFNNLTGLHQHVGNWPGKTVERAEGTLIFEGHEIDVIDLQFGSLEGEA